MKLFVVIRADLPPGAVAAQGVHAAVEFVKQHPEIADRWYDESKNLVLLAVPNGNALRALIERMKREDIAHSPWVEPDWDSLTSVALEPAAEHLLSSLPLALKPEKAAA